MKFPTFLLISLLPASISAGNLFQLLGGSRTPRLDGSQQVPGDNPLKYCHGDHSGDGFTLERMDLIPNPPVRGKPLTIRAVGVLKDGVTKGAYVNISVKLGFITLIKDTLDLGDTDNVDEEPEVDHRNLILTKVYDIPKITPPGKYTVKAKVGLIGEKPLACLTGVVSFSS